MEGIVTCPRFLTQEEAGLIQQGAEHWPRLRDVEINAGEYAGASRGLAKFVGFVDRHSHDLDRAMEKSDARA
jgi:hypothetical protein